MRQTETGPARRFVIGSPQTIVVGNDKIYSNERQVLQNNVFGRRLA